MRTKEYFADRASYPFSVQERAKDVFSWAQEHTNLCQVYTHLGNVDHESHSRLQKRLRDSVDRGKRLLDALLDENSERELEHSERVQTRTLSSVAMIPTSGFHRFEEGEQRSQRAGLSLESNPTPLKKPSPSAAAQMAPLSSPAKSAPLPSRTYIKKAGT
jgi:hypothetical protein